MHKTVQDTIKLLAGKVKQETSSNDALKFTQAALNMAHVLATIDNITVIVKVDN